MSDAAAELNFAASEEADAVMLDLPGQDVAAAPGVKPAEHKQRWFTAGVGDAVSSRFTRLRASLSRGRGKGNEGIRLAAVAGANGEIEAEKTASALGADVKDSSVSPSQPLWRRSEFLGVTSAIALGVVVMGAVAFWPDGNDGSSAAPMSEAGLMAPAAKLATAPRRDAAVQPLVERPPEAPKEKLIDEVESLWGSGAGSKDKERKGDAASGGAAAVSEVGLSPTAVELSKASAGGAALPAHEEDASAKKKAEDAATARVAALTSEQSLKAEPKADEAKRKQIQETELYSMITELSTLVRRTREEIGTLRDDQRKSAKVVEAKLTDFERRLNLGEAQRALDGAKAATTTSQEPPAAATGSAPSAKPASGAAKGVVTASLSTQGEPSPASPAARYRVQAASPGLAMLSEIDRSGEDVLPLQVAVGANVPGYGRVIKISQRGSEWVVQTEKGPIH
jgi:hypothetical protein